MKKRVLAWVLTLLMGIGVMLPAAAQAAEPTVGARSEYNASTGDVFLGGNYIEVGISKHGSFGTSTLPQTNQNWHPHRSASGLGLTSDGDGWDVGSAPVTGDFFLPGTPEERWGFAYKMGGTTYEFLVADRNYAYSGSWSVEPRVSDCSDTANGLLKAVVSGTTSHGVQLTITYSFGVNDKFYSTKVEIVNNSGSEISDVRFMRSFDPDQDQQTQGTYYTYNKVVCNPDPDRTGGNGNFAMVVARGSKTMGGFFFLAFDNRARVSRGVNFAPSSLYLSGLWDTAPVTEETVADDASVALTTEMVAAYNYNGYTYEDNAIAVTFALGTMAAGASDALEFMSSLDPDVSAALSAILALGINYEDEKLMGFEEKEGTYVIEAAGSEYVWTVEVTLQDGVYKYVLQKAHSETGETTEVAKGNIADGVSLQEEWMGTTITIVQKATGEDEVDSEALEVEVATRPSAPDAPTVSDENNLYAKPEDVAESDIITTETSITINGTVGQQYKVNDGEWITPDADGKVVIEGLSAGTSVTVYTRIAATESAPASESSAGTTVTLRNPPGTLSLTVTPYEIVYDGEPHSACFVSVENADFTYSIREDAEYKPVNPSFTEAGRHTVYYRATKDGYEPVYDQTTVTIYGYVTYDGNGATSGSEPTDGGYYLPGDTIYTRYNTGDLKKDGFIFSGWNTEPDGSGEHYAEGYCMEISESVTTLYAEWVEIETADLSGDVRFFYFYEYTLPDGSVQSGIQNEGERSTKVGITLLRDGVAVGEPIVVETVMSDNQAEGIFVFEDMPLTDELGDYFNYSVQASALRDDGTRTGDYAVYIDGNQIGLSYSPECFDAEWKVTVEEWDGTTPVPDSVFVKVLYATEADAEAEDYRVITQQVSGYGTECVKTVEENTLTYSGSYPVWKYQADVGGSYYHKIQIIGYTLGGAYIDVTDEGYVYGGAMVYDAEEDAGSEVMELTYRNTVIPTVAVEGDILINYSYSYTMTDGSVQEGTQNTAERASAVLVELLRDGVVVDSKNVSLTMEGNAAKGSYTFGQQLKYRADGLHSYAVRVTALDEDSKAVTDYSVDITAFDALLTYRPECFDAAWRVTLAGGLAEEMIPTSIHVKILYALESGAAAEDYEIISQQANNLGTECIAVTEEGVTTYSGSYPVWKYQANVGGSYYHKIQIVGYTIDGIYYDVSYRDLISEGEMYFGGNQASELMELTLTPEIPEEEITVSGKVLDTHNVGVHGAKVELRKGSEVIAVTTTDIYGHYCFVNVPDGDYNIVVTHTDGLGEDAGEKILTELIKVEHASGETPNITMEMPAGNVSSVVEIKEETVAYEMMTPAGTLVDGVDELAKNETPGGTQHITIKLEVTPKADVTGSGDAADAESKAEQSAIKTEASGKTVEFLDLTLTKTVTEDGSDTHSSIQEAGTMLKIMLPFDTEQAENIVVYRFHNGVAEVMTENPADGEEGFVVGEGVVTIYARKFSTYAIGYTEAYDPGAFVPVYPVTGPDTENGKVTISSKYPVAGTTVKVTVTPDEGYELDELIITNSKGERVEVTELGDGSYSFKMPAGKVTVNAVFRTAKAVCPKDETCPLGVFTDVSVNAWYHDGAHYCVENGLMKGLPGNLFGPDKKTTRAQLITILWRMEGEPVVNYAMDFEDVKDGWWYTEAIRWAASEKIMEGYGDGRFGPESAITREQLAAVLWRYAGYKGMDVSVGEDTNILSYKDVAEVSGYAVTAMQWACGTGLINGVPDGESMKLSPDGSAIRAQAATMLWRFCEGIAE